MGCRQCDIITTPKRRPIVFDRKESYGRYTSQSYLNHRLPHCRVLLSVGKAPDHPREIFHQIRRPDCGTAKGILYSHSPAIKTEKRQQIQKSVAFFIAVKAATKTTSTLLQKPSLFYRRKPPIIWASASASVNPKDISFIN